ncbi:MAG TPA: YciI family protein [Opitutaceae bacterium]
MKYICLGYIDPNFFTNTPESEQQAMVDSCFTYDDELRANGHFKGGDGLDMSATATLRYINGKIVVTDGPFAETKEQMGGLMVLEARDLNHAVDLISKHPGVKFGPWEIRPAFDLTEMMKQSEERRRVARTFKSTREIPASPEKVFAAFKDPVLLARWWGPDGFTSKFQVCEFKPGGKWVLEMIGPDGKSCHNESVFGVLEPGRKVVIQHVSSPKFELTVSLEATGQGTRVTWEQVFEDYSVANSIRHMVEPANEQNLSRLAAVVTT